MTEIELKFIIEKDNAEELIKSLFSKANYKNSSYELSEMYDLNEILYKDDARLRVRKSKDLLSENEKTLLTYKKPLTREGIKIELEHETIVKDYSELEEILKAIGFNKVSSYERFKHSFFIDKTKFEVQVFPFATFLEIEGDKAEIIRYAKELGFDLSKNITDSCDTVDDNIRKANGLPSRDHILFDNYKKAEDEQASIISKNKEK